jgi:hypothetical protein
LHPKILDEGCLIEWHALRHLLGCPEIDDRRHALCAKIAQRTLSRLAADKHVIAYSSEFVLELPAHAERYGGGYFTRRVLTSQALSAAHAGSYCQHCGEGGQCDVFNASHFTLQFVAE